MNGQYAYTPTMWPSALTVLLLLILAAYSWRQRSVPSAQWFAISCVFAALWAAGSVMEYAAVDVATKIFWVKFQGIWQLPIVTAITCFILEYAWPGRWLTRRNLILLSIPCLLILGLALTNDLHHLIWRGFAYEGKVILQRGPASWIGIAYAFVGLGALNLIVFAWLFRHSPQHRWAVAIILTGQFVGRTVYTLEAVQRFQSDLHLGILGMAFEFLIYALALFGFRILDPISLARQTVITQMREGLLVLDSQGRVASLNPAAERILNAPAKQVKSKLVKELLPAYPEGPGETDIELSLGEGSGLRYFTLTISLLNDFRGLEAGRLLLLRDVTEQKRARESQKQQQLLLATLQERERLARELHDSLGQTLASARLQASTARLLLAQNEIAQADDCMEQIADMSLAVEADVRDYLLAAKTTFSPDRSFFEGLREYTARFSQQYGLRVELSVPPQIEAQGLGLAIELQLMRIIQEALSNVRKHARAKNVQVVFTVSGHLACLAINDDGQGFDAVMVAKQSERFGLQAMRERAEALGGSLVVISQPGQGTQVMVQVPVTGEKRRGEMVK